MSSLAARLRVNTYNFLEILTDWEWEDDELHELGANEEVSEVLILLRLRLEKETRDRSDGKNERN